MTHSVKVLGWSSKVIDSYILYYVTMNYGTCELGNILLWGLMFKHNDNPNLTSTNIYFYELN